jgi:hypothetical protein
MQRAFDWGTDKCTCRFLLEPPLARLRIDPLKEPLLAPLSEMLPILVLDAPVLLELPAPFFIEPLPWVAAMLLVLVLLPAGLAGSKSTATAWGPVSLPPSAI